MAISLAVGAYCTPFVEAYAGRMKEISRRDPLGAILLVLVLIDKIVQSRRQGRLEDAIAASSRVMGGKA